MVLVVCRFCRESHGAERFFTPFDCKYKVFNQYKQKCRGFFANGARSENISSELAIIIDK